MSYFQQTARSRRPRAAIVIRFVAAFSVLALISACGETPTAPSQFAAFSQADLRVGTGAEAVNNSTLSTNYTLWLYSASAAENKGTRIESSVGGTPFSFVLGTSQVIAGMNQGVAGMRVGGLRRIVIPPSLGYGQNRSGIIPPNATLLFEVELLDVTAP